MKIEMLTTMAGPDGVVQAGQVVDLPPAEAKSLLDGGYAKAFHPPAKQPEVETMEADRDGAEKAVRTPEKSPQGPESVEGKKAGNGKKGKRRAGMQKRNR